MQKTVDLLAEQLKGLTGSVSQKLIETIKVDYFGQSVPLAQVGLITENNAGITVSVFDPSTAGQVMQAVKKCGFTAFLASHKVVSIPKPPQTAEEVAKVKRHVGQLAEQAKTAIRNIRREAKKEVDRLPEDQRSREQRNLELVTGRFIEKVELMAP